jgi:methionine-rich copper-binding protein CopC
MKQVTTPRRYSIALGLAVLAVVLLEAVAAAHGPEILVKTDPPDGVTLKQSPARVTAWFNTELETGLSTMQVFDIYHQQVDNGDGGVDANGPDQATMIVGLPTLAEGVYIVRWTAVTAVDGELVAGVFTFAVGENGVTPTQTSAGQTPPVSAGISPPLGFVLAAALGILLAVAVGLVLYFTLVRGGPERA